MSTVTRRRSIAAALAITVLATATACAGGDRAGSSTSRDGAGGPRLATRTAAAGPVEAIVTPRRLDRQVAAFSIELDNHEVELDGDYAKTSSLVVNGVRWTNPTWSGGGPGGHHRSGTLTFTAAGPATGPVALHLGGLPAPVHLRWSLGG